LKKEIKNKTIEATKTNEKLERLTNFVAVKLHHEHEEDKNAKTLKKGKQKDQVENTIKKNKDLEDRLEVEQKINKRRVRGDQNLQRHNFKIKK
jgi:hypothetical protein